MPGVLDPVLRSTSGTDLLVPEALQLLRTELIPLVSWITPNTLEIRALTGMPEVGLEDALGIWGVKYPELHIVATGGDEDGPPVDRLRHPGGRTETFVGERVHTRSTHGTGCAFSSALLSELVVGNTGGNAVTLAKRYVEGALRPAPGLGHGAGPTDLLG